MGASKLKKMPQNALVTAALFVTIALGVHGDLSCMSKDGGCRCCYCAGGAKCNGAMCCSYDRESCTTTGGETFKGAPAPNRRASTQVPEIAASVPEPASTVTATPAAEKPKAAPATQKKEERRAAAPAETTKGPHSNSKTLEEPEEAAKPAATTAKPPASRRNDKKNLPPAPKSRKKPSSTKKDL